jgi:actin-related protein
MSKLNCVQYVYFDSVNADHYIICRQPSHSIANIPEPKEPFYECYDTLLDDDLAERRWRARQEEREKREEKDRQAKANKEAKRKRKEEEERRARAQEAERIRREEEEVLAEDLQLKYVLWQSSWEADVRAKRLLTIFPHLPIAVCTCNEVSCKSRKVPGSLMACQHDVERFFRASGLYSLAWLRKERLLWHPDRFGQRCDPDFRVELRRKATELYAIFETLIVAEKERVGIGDTGSPQASP